MEVKLIPEDKENHKTHTIKLNTGRAARTAQRSLLQAPNSTGRGGSVS